MILGKLCKMQSANTLLNLFASKSNAIYFVSIFLVPCFKGFYCPSLFEGAKRCPNGTFTMQQNATSLEQCEPCPKKAKQNETWSTLHENHPDAANIFEINCSHYPGMMLAYLGQVVRSWASTNSGLKFNPMFQFLYFYISVYFNTLQTKTTIDRDKISKEIPRNTFNKLLESLERNFTLTQC